MAQCVSAVCSTRLYARACGPWETVLLLPPPSGERSGARASFLLYAGKLCDYSQAAAAAAAEQWFDDAHAATVLPHILL